MFPNFLLTSKSDVLETIPSRIQKDFLFFRWTRILERVLLVDLAVVRNAISFWHTIPAI
jgi:hypothetical protein